MSQGKRGGRFFANSLHQELFMTIFLAAFIPALITAIGLFYLIFDITAQEVGFPEAVASSVMPAAKKVIQILLWATPLILASILGFAHKLTHKIVGPFDRIVRELDQIVTGERKEEIVVRKADKFAPLIEKINLLIKKYGK